MKRLVFLILCALFIISCGKKEAKDPGIDKIFQIAKDKMNTEVMLEETNRSTLMDFTEISDDDFKDFRFMMPSTNISVSEIMIVLANEGKLDNAKKALKFHLDNQIEIFKSYVPEQYNILKDAEFFDAGNYVILLVGDGAKEAKDEILKEF